MRLHIECSFNDVITYSLQETQTHTSEDLIEENLDMVDSQRLLRDNDTVQVALHQLRGNVAVSHGQGCYETVHANSSTEWLTNRETAVL